MKEIRSKLDYVDALRGIAILMVLFHHTSFMVKIDIFPIFIQNVFMDLSRGVQIFYIMSAFTLFYSLSQRKTEDKHAILDYSIRRIFRIAPLWYCSIIIFAFLLPLMNVILLGESISELMKLDWQDLFVHLFFLHGLTPEYINSIVIGGWSVGIEMVFYLFVPVLYKTLNSVKKAYWGVIISTIFAFVITILLKKVFQLNDKEYIFYFLPAQLPFFMIGFLLYRIVILKEEFMQKIEIIIVFILGIIAFVFRDTYIYYVWIEVFVLTLLLILFIKYNRNIFNNKFTRYIGKISYSLYLLHFIGIKFVQVLNPLRFLDNGILKYFLSFGIMFGISVGISVLSYKFIEKNGIIFGNKLIQKLEEKRTLEKIN